MFEGFMNTLLMAVLWVVTSLSMMAMVVGFVVGFTNPTFFILSVVGLLSVAACGTVYMNKVN